MGARNPLEAQTATYWQLLKLNQKMRKRLSILATESFPPAPDSAAKQSKQKIDREFKRYRSLIDDFRHQSYTLRAAGIRDCEAFIKHSFYSDPSEIFPNWVSNYRGPNYDFGKMSSDGRSIYPEEGSSFTGFWQLLRNLIPPHDNRLELWPGYFGQSSTGNWELNGGREVLDELRFPLSGFDLQGAVAVDLETSSLSPLTGEILEIGIVEIQGYDPLRWPRFSLRFDLSSELARGLGTGSEHIHGIVLSDLRGKPKITDRSVQKLLQKYLCSGKRIISHNSAFEFRWLSQFVDGFFEANYDNTGLQNVIDTAVLCKFAFLLDGGAGTVGNSLKSTIEELGLDYKNAHQAQADAVMAALAAYGMLKSLGGRSLKELTNEEYSQLLTEPYSAEL